MTEPLPDPEEDLKARLIVRQSERRATSQTDLLERMDAVSVARLVDIGFVDTTPLSFTRPGRRWMKAMGARRVSILRLAILAAERRRAECAGAPNSGLFAAGCTP